MPGTLLVVIDPQEKLTRIIPDWPVATASIKLLVKYAKLAGWDIIVTKQVKLGEIDPLLREELNGLRTYEKEYFNAAQEPEVARYIEEKGPYRIIIVGIETHICILQTAESLLEKGYHVIVPPDAVSSQIKTDHIYALRHLERKGAEIMPVESIIYKDLKIPKHPAFKQALEAVKERRKVLSMIFPYK